MKEIWKDIKKYEGLYQVSNLGKVKSIRNNKLMKLRTDYRGYLDVLFSVNKKTKRYKVHRLVAEAFIPNPHNLPQVNHKDENKQNNFANNLEWCTNEYNYHYGTAIERRTKTLLERYSRTDNRWQERQIIQYDLAGNFIKEWRSIKTASKELNIISQDISACCRKLRKTAKGYIWKYKNEERQN